MVPFAHIMHAAAEINLRTLIGLRAKHLQAQTLKNSSTEGPVYGLFKLAHELILQPRTI